MSSTNRGAQRRPDDFYAAPWWVVDQLLDKLEIEQHMRQSAWWVDPGCGDGAIMDRMLKDGVKQTSLVGFETHARRVKKSRERFPNAAILGEDYLGDNVIGYMKHLSEGQLVIVSNPPYSHAMEFVQRSLLLAAQRPGSVVCCLLRLAFLESKGRAQFHIENPSHVYVLPKRPTFCHSFRCKVCDTRISTSTDVVALACLTCGDDMSKTTTDSSAYAWFVWNDGKAGQWEIL